MKHLIAYGVLGLLFACAKGSKNQDHSSPLVNLSLSPAQEAKRGDLIDASRMISFTKEELDARFKGLNITARNGVHIYKITYQTETPHAVPKPIVASGIVVVPDTSAALYPWISLQHGTIAGQADAPSASPSEGVVDGSQGFVTVVMDYLGFGASSEIFHPYMVEKSYADAGVDMLRAASAFATSIQVNLGPLFLRGYSEGGYGTMALQKALETDYKGEFPVVASAPAAGPYDLELTGRVLMSRPTVNPVNLPFVVLSYERWLSNQDFNPSQIFNIDLNKVRLLFSGAYKNEQIYQMLPSGTDQLFRSEIIADFPSDAPTLPESQKLRTWLGQQSLHNKGWAPITPTRLYHCKDDETVPVEAALSAYESFKSINSESPVVPILIPSPNPEKPYGHGNCPGIFASLQWFGEILKAESH